MRLRRACFALSLAVWAQSPHAEADQGTVADLVQLASALEKPEMAVLGNGLVVVVEHDSRVPLIAMDLRFRVGIKDEGPKERGVATVAARAYTTGGRHFRRGDYDRTLSTVGATRPWFGPRLDYVVFSTTVPAAAAESPLWFWSDAMAWGADALTEQELSEARAGAVAAVGQSMGSEPGQCAGRERDLAIAPAPHPYHFGLAVPPEVLEQIRPDTVRAFIRARFTPENAVLVLTGDITLEQSRSLAEKYFGQIPRGTAPPPVTTFAMPTAGHESRIDMQARTDHTKVILSWPTPPLLAIGDAEFDVLARIWGGEPSPKLTNGLVGGARVASKVSVSQSSRRISSVFQVTIDGAPNVGGDAIIAAFDDWLQRRFTLSEADVNLATRSYVGRKLFASEELPNRCAEYALTQPLTGRPEPFSSQLSRYDVTAKAVTAAWKEYLQASHRVTIVVSPSTSASYCGDVVAPHDGGAR